MNCRVTKVTAARRFEYQTFAIAAIRLKIGESSRRMKFGSALFKMFEMFWVTSNAAVLATPAKRISSPLRMSFTVLGTAYHNTAPGARMITFRLGSRLAMVVVTWRYASV